MAAAAPGTLSPVATRTRWAPFRSIATHRSFDTVHHRFIRTSVVERGRVRRRSDAFARRVVVVLVAGLGGAPNATAQAAPAGALQPHVGAYRFPSGGLLLVGYESDDAMRIRDMEGGTRATLQRIAPERYERDDVRLSFEARQGEAVAVAILRVGDRSRTATRVPLRFDEVSWQSGGARISGTLVLPPGAGSFPLVIAQPGSSWQTRYNEHGMFTALTFAAQGVAGLAYDKRGFGASEGEQLVGFEQTAIDLVAGVDALRGRFDINPRRIILWGLSQGGWIVPLAATMTEVAGVVLVGAAGTTPARQEILRAQAVLRARGFPQHEVDAIRRFQELAFHYGNTGEGWQDYLAARTAAEGKEWLRWVWSPTEPGPEWWMWGRLNGAYNPLPALLELRVPVLAMWGEHDLNVDPEVSRAIFEVALGAAGNRDYSLMVVPSADHELEYATSPRHALEDAPFAEGIWEAMSNWVREKVVVR